MHAIWVGVLWSLLLSFFSHTFHVSLTQSVCAFIPSLGVTPTQPTTTPHHTTATYTYTYTCTHMQDFEAKLLEAESKRQQQQQQQRPQQQQQQSQQGQEQQEQQDQQEGESGEEGQAGGMTEQQMEDLTQEQLEQVRCCCVVV